MRQMHDLVAPGSLAAVLDLLAAEPGEWTPIAGGTELMVAFSAGRLTAPQTRQPLGHSRSALDRSHAESIVIGAAATFLDLREHAVIAAELPLLAKAASWIGSVANQSRATLGGNLVNGSPAADSSPALLAYDAEIEMVSRARPPAQFPTPNFTPATSAMCSPRMNCSTRFICRGASRTTGNTCAKWERGAPWPLRKSRSAQRRCSKKA